MSRDVAADLLEALKALKACRDVIDNRLGRSFNLADLVTASSEANRILAKYPNLK